MPKFKYNSGDRLGPLNILMLERTGKNHLNHWLGRFECPYCGNSFETEITYVSQGDTKSCGCIWDHKEVTNLRGQRFGRLTVLDNSGRKVDHRVVWKCRCDCGNITYVSTNNLKSGHTKSCGCYRKEISSQKLLDLSGKKFGKLTVLDEIKKDSKNKIMWKCQCECGNVLFVYSTNLVKGNTSSCGCIKSKGEYTISQILQKLNINFITQKTFDNCRNKNGRILFFDFYLPDYNCCIEYDGEQHYSSKKGWHKTEKEFEEIKYRDEIKNQYCQNNGIKLIRIPYWDYDKLDENFILSKIGVK